MVNDRGQAIDRYEAIMNEYVAQMEAAAQAFDQELARHTQQLSELVSEGEQQPESVSAHTASNHSTSDHENRAPRHGRGARLFDD